MGAVADPPTAGFCMQCGPDTSTFAYPADQVLRCAVCGWETRLAQRTLFVVAGVSGSGKTTVAEQLPAYLPECDTFDADLTLRIAELGWDVWRDTWLQLAHAIALNGRTTILCTTFVPDQLEALPSRALVGEIRFCLLDAPDAVLRSRLTARPPWRGSTPEFIDRQLRWASRLRSHLQPRFDTSILNETETAQSVAAWARQINV